MRPLRIREALRRCRRRRQARPAPADATPTQVGEQRVTVRGNRIDVTLLRGFLKRTLEDDAVADTVDELIFDHVVAGRYHPSVVAENLPSYIEEILGVATSEDWQAVADELIAEAREVHGEV